MTQTRLKFIDFCKGLGILAVVIGHVFSGKMLIGFLYFWHMPLFFFLTGYLHKMRSDWRLFASNKLKQLIIPYLTYLVIIYSCQQMLFFQNNNFDLNIVDLIKLIGRPLLGYTSGMLAPFWFVPTLFILLIVMNYVETNFHEYTVLWFVAFSLVFSYIFRFIFPDIMLPYAVDNLFAVFPIFYSGQMLKKFHLRWLSSLLLALGVLGLVLVFNGYQNFYNIKFSQYGIPFVTFITSMGFVYSIVEFSRRKNLNFLILNKLGEASLVIMYLHQPTQILIENYVSPNPFLRVFCGITIPYILYGVFNTSGWCRALFTGSLPDLDNLLYFFKSKVSKIQVGFMRK